MAISLKVRSKFFASFKLLSEYPLSIVNVKSTLETSLPVNNVLRTTVLLNFESDKSAPTNVELTRWHLINSQMKVLRCQTKFRQYPL